MSIRSFFITGASGFVGQHLIQELLQDQEAIVYALIRSRGNVKASHRVQNIFHKLPASDLNRIIPIEGEITKDKFGLSDEVYQELTDNVQAIFHTAASVKFNLPYEEAKQINVAGTKNAIDLASAILIEI